ncbi:MAG: lytic transglycosylase domain-containing protein [Streptosporangiaceae bacterium]
MSQHRRRAASKRKPRRSVRAFLLTTVLAAIFVAGGARYVIGQFSVQAANPLADALTAIPASKQGAQLAHQRQHMILMAAATKSFKVVGKPKVAKLPPPPPPASTGIPSTGGGTAYVPIPSPGTAQHIAYGMLASFGFSTSQFSCLNDIWSRESGWSVTAANASGAYGIPQALPGSKMASAGPNWQTSATTQISWGLGYIKERYGSPCNAWAFWQGHSWY